MCESCAWVVEVADEATASALLGKAKGWVLHSVLQVMVTWMAMVKALVCKREVKEYCNKNIWVHGIK